LVYGEYTKDWFQGKGADTKNVIVTGASRYDLYYNKDSTADSDNFRKRTMKNRTKLILFVLSEAKGKYCIPTFHHNIYNVKQLIRQIGTLADNKKDFMFIIRPHSKDNLTLNLLKQEADRLCKENMVVDKSMDLKPLLNITDACIGFHSTVLVEAMVCGIPVITMSHPDTHVNVCSYNDYGLSIHVDSFDDIESLLERMFDNNNRTFKDTVTNRIKQNAYRINYNNDGNATKRIAEYLMAM